MTEYLVNSDSEYTGFFSWSSIFHGAQESCLGTPDGSQPWLLTSVVSFGFQGSFLLRQPYKVCRLDITSCERLLFGEIHVHSG